MIIAEAGRRVDAPGAAPPRFPVDNIEWVGQGVKDMLTRCRATALVTSAACGADLLALQAAGSLGLRRRVVLPFATARFRETSVIDRPDDWGALFDQVIQEVSAAGDLVVLTGQPDGDAAYAAVNTAILDEAQALGKEKGEDVGALLVWDGKSRGEGDLTEAFGAAATARGLQVFTTPTLKP